MPDKLKDTLFSHQALGQFAAAIQEAYPPFDDGLFLRLVFDEAWTERELKERLSHITECLHQTLPDDYRQAVDILSRAIPAGKGFLPMVCSDYVACYGLEHWDVSLAALAHFTRFGSSEFAIRPFIAHDAARAMAVLAVWATDENEHVRRLASEGCRPRLPWGLMLAELKRDPTPILPILELLKGDESEYVRKSVANNLNEISKDHPHLALQVAGRWYGHNPRTDWIVRHALRTLLKAGNPEALALLGVAPDSRLEVSGFQLDRSTVPVGSSVGYSFVVKVSGAEPCLVRLELRVECARPGGKLSRKVFAIRTVSLEPGGHIFKRRLSLANGSTRQHFPGPHRLVLVANGSLVGEAVVEVVAG